MRTWLAPAIPLLTLGLAACGDTGVAAIRIQLNPDLSGTMTASALLVPDRGSPLEDKSGGVSWGDRATLFCSSGSFKALSEVKLADITFEASTTAGRNYLRAYLPRGKDVQWPTAFTPAPADRQRVASTFDPRGQVGSATTHLSIQVDLPGPVITNGVEPRARGMEPETSDKTRATLVVPVDRASGTGQPFLWEVSWR